MARITKKLNTWLMVQEMNIDCHFKNYFLKWLQMLPQVGQIHLPLNMTLMDDTTVKWAIIKLLFFIQF